MLVTQYIGQTTNLSKRFRKHQSGLGSFGTSRPGDQPFAVAGYITGPVHFSETGYMSLERQWRQHHDMLQDKSVANIVDCGIHVAEEANQEASANEEMQKISFVRMIDRDTLVRRKSQIDQLKFYTLQRVKQSFDL